MESLRVKPPPLNALKPSPDFQVHILEQKERRHSTEHSTGIQKVLSMYGDHKDTALV